MHLVDDLQTHWDRLVLWLRSLQAMPSFAEWQCRCPSATMADIILQLPSTTSPPSAGSADPLDGLSAVCTQMKNAIEAGTAVPAAPAAPTSVHHLGPIGPISDCVFEEGQCVVLCADQVHTISLPAGAIRSAAMDAGPTAKLIDRGHVLWGPLGTALVACRVRDCERQTVHIPDQAGQSTPPEMQTCPPRKTVLLLDGARHKITVSSVGL